MAFIFICCKFCNILAFFDIFQNFIVSQQNAHVIVRNHKLQTLKWRLQDIFDHMEIGLATNDNKSICSASFKV
jgi:hypothetical protein